jgi:hypothetical protein
LDYHTVFDASRNGGQVTTYFLIPVFAAIPGLIGWALLGSEDKQSKLKGQAFVFVSAVGIVCTVSMAVGAQRELRQIKKALDTGDYQVSEGIVSNFVPMPPGGHATESFAVGQDDFEYGSGWGSITFNSEWNKGYLHNGLQVRIAHRNGAILRIEVKDAKL